MSEEEKSEESGEISRREFLKDAGFVAGGAGTGSIVLLSACGPAAETVTTTTTVTETVSNFVCPYCSQQFASLAVFQSHVETEHPSEKLTKLVVNGVTNVLKIEPQWSLSHVLRDKLELTGTKVSCNRGPCGACTVLIDGSPILSCMTLAIECEGKSILTIEGLQKQGQLDPIQESFIQHDAFQCGFCTPGMIMAAKALLDKNPAPTVNEVKEALSGVLCRCGSYPNIIDAVMGVSEYA